MGPDGSIRFMNDTATNDQWHKSESLLGNEDSKSVPCVGVVTHMDDSFRASWCARLQPNSKRCEIYVDSRQSIVYVDCGCHRYIVKDKFKLNHQSIKDCNQHVDSLLQYAVIGYENSVSRHAYRYCKDRFQSTGFSKSYPILKSLDCKSCRVLLCIKLSSFLKRYRCGQFREFTRMMFIYVISKMLCYCLSSWHTASYWTNDIKGKDSIMKFHLMHFIHNAMSTLTGFHSTSTENDRCDAILMRLCSQQFTEFMRLFLKRFRSISESKQWTVLNAEEQMTTHSIKAARGLMDFYLNEKTVRKKRGYDTMRNSEWMHRNVLEKLSKMSSLYITFVLREQNWSRIRKCKQLWIRKSKAKDRGLMLRSVECQYKHCHKTGEILEQKLKKCGGCGIARYCSRLCQKRDWVAFHRATCVLFHLNNDDEF